MQSIEDLEKDYRNDLRDSLNTLMDGKRPISTAKVMESIERMIDMKTQLAVNKLRNELDREIQKLIQRVSELDGKYP